MDRYYQLLTKWCDRLISLQLRELKDRRVYGGIVCPSCALIHGRIGDAVYPFVLLYDKTGDQKYLEAAKLVVDWTENNLLRENGSYYNDRAIDWRGISAFSGIALAETLLYHGDCLEQEIYDKWKTIFVRLVEFIYTYFDSEGFYTNINYYAAEAHMMALAYKMMGEERYKEKAYEKAEFLKQHFSDDGLLFGEGPKEYVSEKNCVFVDIDYNVEESLPSLIHFADLMKDEEYIRFFREKYAIQLEFMLPDGAWDNSWGSRADKWSYWGGRTSDGAQVGLCLLAAYDPMFAEAAQRNFELYEECSSDGFLYGGKMYIEAEEDPCVHHSFCHAKALCAMIDLGFQYQQKVTLPREKEYGLKTFPSVQISLIAKGDWRATVNGSDAVVAGSGKATTGGSVSLLWNNKIGPVFAATMAKYNRGELTNMQLSRHYDEMTCGTPRISDGEFESVNDIYAVVASEENDQRIRVTAKGTLRDINFAGTEAYEIEYLFEHNRFTVTAKAQKDCTLKLPVISSGKDKVMLSGNQIEVDKGDSVLTLSSEALLELDHAPDKRCFHVVGGFLMLGVSVKLKAGVPVKVTMEVG